MSHHTAGWLTTSLPPGVGARRASLPDPHAAAKPRPAASPALWVDIRPKELLSLGRMPTRDNAADRIVLLQGTLDLLILRTLVLGPQHGQGIARAIQQSSDDVLLVDHGSLYPALQRLETKGWIDATWGTSGNNRKARFYELTPRGREQLARQADQWRRLVVAIGRVLGPDALEG